MISMNWYEIVYSLFRKNSFSESIPEYLPKMLKNCFHFFFPNFLHSYFYKNLGNTQFWKYFGFFRMFGIPFFVRTHFRKRSQKRLISNVKKPFSNSFNYLFCFQYSSLLSWKTKKHAIFKTKLLKLSLSYLLYGSYDIM